ncbi:PucR family transcriptional regulator [Nocardia yamanashiensis]|uniref:helix-turn-helix domain-containing protein n=1 Tax=Nocardia yamanashiensis TaxID=209247 RepID=UPI001E5F9838|nr:PucR family transcriptional regulator [Nocardia yamanashiensis]UGT41823.1 PucR family transcriptional regulator [Nocardia yamanashiensis]
MRVRDILGAPQLRMRLLHGDTEALDRPVARVCATDMPDPRPFVTPGALVCTGLVWRKGSGDSDRYIGLLAGAGVAGVVAGQALHGHVPEDVVTACEKYGLPLLSAPQSMPFSRIIEHLADQAAEQRWQRVQSRADRQRRMLSAVAAGKTIDEILAEIAAEQDISAWLITATGSVIAGTAPLSGTDLNHAVSTAATAPRLPAVTTGALRVLQVGAGDRRTAWFLVLRPAAPDPEPFGPDLAAVAELYRQRAADRLHLSWELADRFPAPPAERTGEQLVAVVCAVHTVASAAAPSSAARTGSTVASRSGSDRGEPGGPAGIDNRPARPMPALNLENSVAAAEVAVVRAVLHDIFPGAETSVDAEGRIVMAVRDGGPAAQRHGCDDASRAMRSEQPNGSKPEVNASRVAAVLRERLGRMAFAAYGIRLAVGVSVRQDEETWSAAVAAAEAACTAARDDAAQVSVRVADIDSAVGLFTAVPGGLQRRFAERVLGPVVEYDRRNGGGLLETLEVFLGCEGSWRVAAERMHVHLNTVRYRIGRVEELTGRDLGRLDDRLDLYLAMRTLGGQTAPV